MIARRKLRETTMNNQKFKTCLWESLKPIYNDLGFLATPIEEMNSVGQTIRSTTRTNLAKPE